VVVLIADWFVTHSAKVMEAESAWKIPSHEDIPNAAEWQMECSSLEASKCVQG
jgi:hypothetical protein